MKVNLFANSSGNVVSDTLHITEVLLQIQSGKYSDTVSKCRDIGKGNSEYDKLKRTLPLTNFKVTYNGKRSKDNISGITGFIYIDLDWVTEYTPNNMVYACWKSISGQGYSILVKADGLSQSNYKHNYYSVAELLGIEPDAAAANLSQCTFLSWDTDLYVNPNSVVYKAIEPRYTVIQPIQPIQSTEEGNTFLLSRSSIQHVERIKWDNTQELFDEYSTSQDQEYIILQQGTGKMVKLYTTKNKLSDGRKRSLQSFLNGLFYLNPWLQHEGHINRISGVVANYSRKSFTYPIDQRIVDEIINKALITKPKLIPSRQQNKILLNKELLIEKRIDFRTVINKALGELRSSKTLCDIQEWMNTNPNGSVTRMSKELGISRKTIYKHIKQKQNEKQ
jgi:hypothetical protein